ncbi:MAG: hypothetical protein AAF141_11845 [Pseudomonadota bacterium]
MLKLKPAMAGLFALGVLGSFSSMAAASTACSVTADGLSCPGETRAEIMNALASDETSKAFADPRKFATSLGADGGAREAFRRELESIRRTVERQQRADRRAERRGHINPEEFSKREATYLKAIANYREGYWFYQNLGWRSEN